MDNETPSAAIALATANATPTVAVDADVRRGRCRGAEGRTTGVPPPGEATEGAMVAATMHPVPVDR